MMLAVLSSFPQEESRSMSENNKHPPFPDGHSLIQDILAILRGSNIFPFFKSSTKVAFAVKAGAEGDVLDGDFRGVQHILGCG